MNKIIATTNLTKSTLSGYATILNKMERYMIVTDDITDDGLREYILSFGAEEMVELVYDQSKILSDNTMRKMTGRVVTVMQKICEIMDIVPNMILSGSVYWDQNATPKNHANTPQEIQALYNSCKTSEERLLFAYLLSGVRMCDYVVFARMSRMQQIEDIDFVNNTITIHRQKNVMRCGEKITPIRMSKILHLQLLLAINNGEEICPMSRDDTGDIYSPSHIRFKVRETVRKIFIVAGVDPCYNIVHALRYTVCTAQVASGASTDLLCNQMGWKADPAQRNKMIKYYTTAEVISSWVRLFTGDDVDVVDARDLVYRE